jgi:hypothetical protein
MGTITEPLPVKFFCGAMYTGLRSIEEIRDLLTGHWGPIDFVSGPLPFNYTDYYNDEMGVPIFKVFFSFRELMPREELVDKKLQSNSLEELFKCSGKRQVNLDPGYLTLGQLFLASTKDHEQRVYLGRGIFAEVTLKYSQKSYHVFPWTYRDYATEEYQKIFLEMRTLYQRQLKERSLGQG